MASNGFSVDHVLFKQFHRVVPMDEVTDRNHRTLMEHVKEALPLIGEASLLVWQGSPWAYLFKMADGKRHIWDNRSEEWADEGAILDYLKGEVARDA